MPLTVTLSERASQYIQDRVASGRFPDAQSALEAIFERIELHDPAFDDWLQREVIATYQAGKADPSRLKSSQETFEILRAHMANKLGKAAA